MTLVEQGFNEEKFLGKGELAEFPVHASLNSRCFERARLQRCRVLALELRQVSVLVVVALGGVFHKLEELAQALTLGDGQF